MTDSSSDPAPGSPDTGGRRSRRRLLIASIVLNVFLIGAIGAGVAMRHGPHFFDGDRVRPPRPFEMPSPRKIRAALPDSARPVAEAMFTAHRGEVREKIGALIDARRQVAAAIRAEPFDRAALDMAMATLRTREADVAGKVQSIIADLVTELDADSRARIATLLDVRHEPDHPR
jgi:uncharacterized membrane protein